jgi:hypothetical protein
MSKILIPRHFFAGKYYWMCYSMYIPYVCIGAYLHCICWSKKDGYIISKAGQRNLMTYVRVILDFYLLRWMYCRQIMYWIIFYFETILLVYLPVHTMSRFIVVVVTHTHAQTRARTQTCTHAHKHSRTCKHGWKPMYGEIYILVSYDIILTRCFLFDLLFISIIFIGKCIMYSVITYILNANPFHTIANRHNVYVVIHVHSC